DEDPEYKSGLGENVENYKPVLVILETRGTLYDLFLPLVLRQLVEEVGYLPPHLRPRREPRPDEDEDHMEASASSDDEMEYEDLRADDIEGDETVTGAPDPDAIEMKPVIEMSRDEFEGKPETIIFLDAATHLSKFTKSFNFALGIPDRFPNISVAAAFFTDREHITETLQKGVEEYMKDWALVFDLHPHLFDVVTSNLPISKKAWLMGRLQELERVRSEGGVGFLEYYSSDLIPWKLHVVEKPERGIISEVKSWFRRWH
ncbi:MAG: hypothetical protein ACP6IT_11195, partial [Candidatus Thorarchaeota archaeon]